jgi:hypothetical protein
MTSATRENVLGYRARAQGLDRSGDLGRLLEVGIQDTPAGTAATVLAARGVHQFPEVTRIVWSWRGAPHVHREGDLKALAAATWPVDDADATRRISNPRIKQGAKRGLGAFAAAATALREAVTEKLPKGEVSRRVSASIPDDLNFDCPPCASRHISGGLFQLVGVAAGVEVLTEGRSTYLKPLPSSLRMKQLPQAGNGLGEMLLRYLRVNGPASTASLAAHTGMTTATALKPHLPPGLVEVETPLGKAWMVEDRVDELLRAERPEFVRLLPGGDPWLTVRDRELVIPDAAQHKAVYKSLSNPGVVLVNGDVIGTWRAKLGRAKVLEVAVTGFAAVPERVRALVEAEAQLLAPSRRAEQAAVSFA